MANIRVTLQLIGRFTRLKNRHGSCKQANKNIFIVNAFCRHIREDQTSKNVVGCGLRNHTARISCLYQGSPHAGRKEPRPSPCMGAVLSVIIPFHLSLKLRIDNEAGTPSIKPPWSNLPCDTGSSCLSKSQKLQQIML